MNLSGFYSQSQRRPLPEPEYFSAELRLRPNYLVYTCTHELSPLQLGLLDETKTPRAEYRNTSLIASLVSFLIRLGGGLYLPRLDRDLDSIHSVLSIFLVDPHVIDHFESTMAARRLGVLLRRPLVASSDFREVVNLP